jgi:hypothetical protein
MAVATSAAERPTPRIPAPNQSVQASSELAAEQRMVEEIVTRSFPHLAHADIRLSPFRSDSDYFRPSFGAARFLTGVRMRYFILINRAWATQGAPSEGVQSILAHELAHLEDLSQGKRIRLFRLAGLLSRTRRARFERRADLLAIARGYGPGLKAYRVWLYAHVPAAKLAEKRRNYLSPEEIDAVLEVTARRPDLFEYWRRHVPLTMAAIQSVR